MRTLRRLAAIGRAVGASGKPGRAVGGTNLSSYRSAMKLRSGVAAADIWRGMSVILDLPEPAGRTTWPSRKSAPLDRAKRTNDAPHWSLKFEYDYLGLGNRTFVIPATAPLLAGDTSTPTPQCPNGESWYQLPVQLGLQSLLKLHLTAADHKGSGSRIGARSISLPADVAPSPARLADRGHHSRKG